MFTSTHLHH